MKLYSSFFLAWAATIWISGYAQTTTGDITGLQSRVGSGDIKNVYIRPVSGQTLFFSGNPSSPFTVRAIAATDVASGTLSDSRLSANVSLLGSSIALTSEVTGTLPVANGGTGITSLGTGVATWLGTPSVANLNTALGSTVLVSGGAAGTPSSITLTNGTGLPVSTGISGLGTGVATWLGTPSLANLNTALGTTLLTSGGAAGTPSSITLTNGTGLPLTTGVTGTLPVANGGTGITSLGAGVATWLGTPSLANLNTALGSTLVTSGGAAGTPSSITLTNGTGLPLTTGVTGTLPVANGGTGITSLGTGVATWLGTPSLANLNTALGSTLITSGGAAGTPSSITLTNGTGLPIVGGTTGTLSVARGGTGQTTFTDGEILIGNSGGGLSKATLTAGANVTITNGDGTITIAASGGMGGGSELPDVTGHNGHILTVNSGTATWSDTITGGFTATALSAPVYTVSGTAEAPGLVSLWTSNNTFKTELSAPNASANRQIYLPDEGAVTLASQTWATGEFVTQGDFDTYTSAQDAVNTSVSGSLSTLSSGKASTGDITTSGLSMTAGVVGRTSGSGSPSILSVNQILDLASGTPAQGNVLYRNASGWVLLAPGTSGQVLQTGGAGANPSWATPSGGGVTTGGVDNAIVRADGTGGSTSQGSDLLVEDATTSTQNNVCLTNNHSGQSTSSLVLAPKGSGAVIFGAKPTGSSTSGNARGANAFDGQTLRNAASQVASGTESVALGSYSTANGSRAVAIGYGVSTSGTAAVALGGFGTSSGDYSLSAGFNATATATASFGLGSYAAATHKGELALAPGRRSVTGDTETCIATAYGTTSNNTITEIFLDGSSAKLTIPSNQAFFVRVSVVGKQASSANVYAAERRFVIVNNGGTTSLDGGAAQTIGTDFNTPAWGGITISADDTGDYAKFQVTGASATTIYWVVSIYWTVVG